MFWKWLSSFLFILSTITPAIGIETFPDQENLHIVHRVNVITGELEFSTVDSVVKGPSPLPITRSYSSGTCSQKNLRIDTPLTHLFQNGWSFLSQLEMEITPAEEREEWKVSLLSSNGAQSSYIYAGSANRKVLFFEPYTALQSPCEAVHSPNFQCDQYIKLETAAGRAVVYLPNGGSRIYKGNPIQKGCSGYHYLLVKERLPNGRMIGYTYTTSGLLKRMELKSPRGKVHSWITFRLGEDTTDPSLEIETSDHAHLVYKADPTNPLLFTSLERRGHPTEVYSYDKETHALSKLAIGNLIQFVALYTNPSDPGGAKVTSILGPTATEGELHTVAHFDYQEGVTSVRDALGRLTRYHHRSNQLTLIEYFQENDLLYSQQKFTWDGCHLRKKTLLDAQGNLVLTKTFTYDSLGNLLREELEGNLTGASERSSYSKEHTYLPRFNVPLLEVEENGLTFIYHYHKGTNLLTAKLTCARDQVLKREFFLYNEHHLLAIEIVDDGSTDDPNDLSRVTQRRIKRYEHLASGFPKTVAEYFLENGRECLIRKTEFLYSQENRITQERIFDSQGDYRYTLFKEYDILGCVVSCKAPCGQESSYRYNPIGKLIESQEVGAPPVHYTYNCLGQLIEEQGNGKRTETTYNQLGWKLREADERGRETHYSYDSFGRVTKLELPETTDDQGMVYRPVVQFSYDLQGNISSETTGEGKSSTQDYTILKKPYRILHPDGSVTYHLYNPNGTIAKTLLPNGAEIMFTYDILQRVISKKILENRKVLSEEHWEYNTFHLLSYTDPKGLRTHYSYNGAGQKIEKRRGDRTTHYRYDPLGFLEETTDGVLSSIKKHDVLGRVVEEWTEDSRGVVENKTRHLYVGNHKTKTYRTTSQGEACDTFLYDDNAQLSAHIDPLGNQTEFHSSFKEGALQKTTLDPLGNGVVETYDALGRLTQIEKRNRECRTVSKEALFYDRSGNKTRVTTTLYEKDQPLKSTSVEWEYNTLGQVIKETEAEGKVTSYRYFPEEKKEEKILPNGIIITSIADSLGRPKELQSSDGSVHYQYHYHNNGTHLQITDLVHDRVFERWYNLFGELKCDHLGVEWSYDAQGRCTALNIPQAGTILYDYQGAHLARIKRLSPEKNLLYEHRYVSFDPNGRVEEETLLGSLGTIYTEHDLFERPNKQTSPWIIQSVDYNSLSLVTQKKSSLTGTQHYEYDPLGQITRSGEEEFQFNSIGNPTEYEVNDYNQLLTTPDCAITYDENGNPIQLVSPNGAVYYTYDALGRLTEIKSQDTLTTYQYDPFSRLYAKIENGKTFYYLYDKEKEIGLLNEQGELIEFRTLGLGIRGEIGGTVAIELQGEVFAPLHDFQGNVIALVSTEGQIVESSDFDPFGNDKNTLHRNPWRFASKRTEPSGLVFFGMRFYEPKLKRFLTPDPSGFADGPNLYAFNHNSPLNRIDLLGLNSESNFLVPLHINLSVEQILSGANTPEAIHPCQFVLENHTIDGYIFCGHFHKLQFAPGEIDEGQVDILEHLKELVSLEGRSIDIMTIGNGINTSLNELKNMCQSVVDKIPEGILLLGIHNVSSGFFSDLFRVGKELYQKQDTPIIKSMGQILTGVSERLRAVNDKALFVHLMHSENGLITCRAIEGMEEEWKNMIKFNLFFAGYGTVIPVPEDYGFGAVNLYSEEDTLTLGLKKYWYADKTYDIRIVPCISKWYEKSAFIFDHAFMAPTGQQAVETIADDLRKKYGFYGEGSR